MIIADFSLGVVEIGGLTMYKTIILYTYIYMYIERDINLIGSIMVGSNIIL